MGLGLRIRLSKTRVWLNVQRAGLLGFLFGFEEVVTLIRRLDKASTQAVLKHFGARIGRNCDLESGLTIHGARGGFKNLTVEDDCHIGKQVFLDLTAPVHIHKACTISMRSMILTHFDPGYARIGETKYNARTSGVEIGPGTYLGAGVIVLPGIRVGESSVVGAGAMVNRDVPRRSLATGVPARSRPL
jgi:acetyltransferase-like isoleucine patch superfamily enzyme